MERCKSLLSFMGVCDLGNGKTKVSHYDIAVLIFSYLIAGAVWLCIVCKFKDMALTLSATLFLFALILIHFARSKQDDEKEIRTNFSLIQFYLKSAFLLICVASFLAIVAVFHNYWPHI